MNNGNGLCMLGLCHRSNVIVVQNGVGGGGDGGGGRDGVSVSDSHRLQRRFRLARGHLASGHGSVQPGLHLGWNNEEGKAQSREAKSHACGERGGEPRQIGNDALDSEPHACVYVRGFDSAWICAVVCVHMCQSAALLILSR